MLSYIVNNPLTFISILFSMVMVVVALINCIKSGNLKQLFIIINEIPNLIKEAETLIGNGNGKVKFNYVKNAVKIMCLSKGVKINDDVIETIINEQVEMSKNVNVKGGQSVEFKSEQIENEKATNIVPVNTIIN